jgi:hypothetical protein
VFAYQLDHGVSTAPSAGRAIRHSCDETSCENWDHLLIGTQPENVWDYRARPSREDGPLALRMRRMANSQSATANGRSVGPSAPVPTPTARDIRSTSRVRGMTLATRHWRNAAK